MREVLDLGSKVENFVFPVENRFLLYQESALPLPGSNSLIINNNILPAGIPLSCDSLTCSDVRNCNYRIANGALGKTAEGLWNSMTKLGITNVSNEFNPIYRLQDLERH